MNEHRRTKLTPRLRAIIATLIFAAFGIFGIIHAFPYSATALPAIVFYALLLWNDYFSIEHFSKIVPPEKFSQVIVDTLLVFIHFLAALSFNNPLNFGVSMMALFILATYKYACDLPAVEHPRELYRKMKIDSLGGFAAAMATAGILLGYAPVAMAIWTGIFIVSTVYVIYINPLYKFTIGTA